MDLRLDLRHALFPLGELRQIFDHLRHAETLAEALGDHWRLGRVYRFLGNYCTQTGDYDGAITYGERALGIANLLGDAPLQIGTSLQLGRVAYEQGDYYRSIDCLSGCVASLDGQHLYEYFGLAAHVSVMSRVWLIWSLAELGAFVKGMTHGEEALRIAESVDHPLSRVVASMSVGLLSLRKGDVPQAIPRLEQSLELCQVAHIRSHLPAVASALGYAYALAGRVGDAFPLLEQAEEQLTSMTRIVDQAFCRLCVSEVSLIAGRADEASQLTERTVEQCRVRKERGYQAYALHLLGDIAAQREPPASELAEVHYQHALALAEELGMRPPQAHCHHGLGILYRQTGRDALAHTALSTAIAMYRAMDMTFWLPQAEAALAQGKG